MTKENVASIINEMKVKYIEYIKEMFKYADLKKSSGDLDYEYYEAKEVKEAASACAIWECVEIINMQANIYTEILRQYFINHPQSIDKYTFLQNSAFTHWVKEKCSKMC